LALRMFLVLLTGNALAKAPFATRVLEWLPGCARSQRRAVTLVAIVADERYCIN